MQYYNCVLMTNTMRAFSLPIPTKYIRGCTGIAGIASILAGTSCAPVRYRKPQFVIATEEDAFHKNCNDAASRSDEYERDTSAT